MKRRRVVDLKNARSADYRKALKAIAQDGKCPFCPRQFIRNNKNPVVLRSGNWFLTRARWPYENAGHHFLIIRDNHAEHIFNLTPDDFASIGKLVQLAARKFRLRGGGLAGRFGDTRYTGATVCHLHFHLIVPKRIGKPVIFPIG